jgi:hypothetical protein
MSVDQMREYVIKRYPGSLTWAARVKKMPDNQVMAIYYNLKQRESLWRMGRGKRRKTIRCSSCRSSGESSRRVRSCSYSSSFLLDAKTPPAHSRHLHPTASQAPRRGESVGRENAHHLFNYHAYHRNRRSLVRHIPARRSAYIKSDNINRPRLRRG